MSTYLGPYVTGSAHDVPGDVPDLTIEELGMIVAALEREIGSQRTHLDRRAKRLTSTLSPSGST